MGEKVWINVLAWLLTRVWGHFLIPILLGSIFWGVSGFWLGWDTVGWLTWFGAFLTIGWFLTVASWTRYYWHLYIDRIK
jgi:hypothetical protein